MRNIDKKRERQSVALRLFLQERETAKAQHPVLQCWDGETGQQSRLGRYSKEQLAGGS